MQKLLLKGGKVFDGQTFLLKDVLIENGKIAALGNVESEDALHIDVSGCLVSSGLVDIHTHLWEMGCPQFGFPADLATIPFGVTYSVDACSECSDNQILDNLCVETRAFIPVQIKGDSLDYASIEEKLSNYGKRAIGIKVFFDESQNNSITIEHLRLACEFAQSKNLKVMVHSTGSPVPMENVIETLNTGDILTHTYHGGKHTVEENNYIAYHLAKEKGVVIDAGMAGGCLELSRRRW